MNALRCVKTVELVDIPVLTKCVFLSAFKCVEDVKMENAGEFENEKELKEAIERKKRRREEEEEERRKRLEEERRRRMEEEERRRREEEERLRREREEAAAMAKKKVVISCKRDWDSVDKRVGVIKVSDGCCNEVGLKELDLSGFVNLRELKVGNECFMYVDEVKLIRLHYLESVVIGMNSFTKEKNNRGNDRNRHFYLKNCPKLKSLKTGRYSFNDYSVFEIENVNALEVIEMGSVHHLYEVSRSFAYASLELKSIRIHSE